MTRSERSEFRAHCKAEAERFDADDTPVSRILRRQKEKQARALRRVRIAMYVVAALMFYLGWRMLEVF